MTGSMSLRTYTKGRPLSELGIKFVVYKKDTPVLKELHCMRRQCTASLHIQIILLDIRRCTTILDFEHMRIR